MGCRGGYRASIRTSVYNIGAYVLTVFSWVFRKMGVSVKPRTLGDCRAILGRYSGLDTDYLENLQFPECNWSRVRF